MNFFIESFNFWKLFLSKLDVIFMGNWWRGGLVCDNQI